jgi:hypothetical protein
MRPLLVLLVLLLFPSLSSAADIYVAQNASGGNTGADCANAHSAAWFNTSANWGTAAGQIGPGTTVHLCGTFTGTANSTMLTVQGSGSAGNPVKILFEANAQLTSPAWSGNGAIACTGFNYITIDGGTNGIIPNGTGLANSVASAGIVFDHCQHTEVRNLTIKKMYIHSGTGSDGGGTGGINYFDNSGTSDFISLHDNTITDMRTAIDVEYNTLTSLDIYNNTTNNHVWGFHIADTNVNKTATGIRIHDNKIGPEFAAWFDSGFRFHFDGMILAVGNAGSTLANMDVYNNYVHGNMNVNGTGYIFVTCVNANSCKNVNIYNNLIVHEQNGPNGDNRSPEADIVLLGGLTVGVYNNTLVNNIGIRYWDYSTTASMTFKNNNFLNQAIGIDIRPNRLTDITASDHNDFFGCTNVADKNSGPGPPVYYQTLANWLVQGFDANSSSGDPKVDGTYHLLSGSSAIGVGVNLTSLGISVLNADKDGVLRAPSGPWDMGAYAFPTGRPNPPTNLRLQ